MSEKNIVTMMMLWGFFALGVLFGRITTAVFPIGTAIAHQTDAESNSDHLHPLGIQAGSAEFRALERPAERFDPEAVARYKSWWLEGHDIAGIKIYELSGTCLYFHFWTPPGGINHVSGPTTVRMFVISKKDLPAGAGCQ